jgi:signal transduction histidine kinase/tetratricopeptide (TPR) repeat protein
VYAFLHLSLLLPAQVLNKDSLQNVLANTKDARTQVDVLNELAFQYYDFNDSIALSYAAQAIAEGEKAAYSRGLQYAHTLAGVGHFTHGRYQQALDEFRKSERYSAEGTLQHTVYNLMLKGNVQTDLGYYDSAALQYNAGLALIIKANDRRYEGGILKGLARLNMTIWKNEEALRYLQLADSARKDDTGYDRVDLDLVYAQVFTQLGNNTEALRSIEKVCTLSADKEDYYHKAMCHLVRADIYYEQGLFPQALQECFKAMNLSDIYGYQLLRALLYLRMGETYFELSEYQLASDFFYRALKLTEQSGLRPITATIYSELAWVNKETGNYSLALDFAQRSLRLRESMNDRRGVANSKNVQGLIYMLQLRYTEALRIHEEALDIRRKLNYRQGISASLYNIGLVYEALSMFDKALELQLEALVIDEQEGNQQSLAISYNGLAALYLKMGNLEEAEKNLSKVSLIATRTKSRLLRRNYLLQMAELEEKKGRLPEALYYRKAHLQLSDSMYTENTSMKLAEMQTIYQIDQKEKEIDLLNRERILQATRITLQEGRIKYQNAIIIVGSAAFLISAVFIYFIKRVNKKLKKSRIELAEVNEELVLQSEELRDSNQTLEGLNRKLAEQQEEIQAQAEELRESNTSLLVMNDSLVEKTNEIEAQAEELREANEAISSINQSLEKRVDERTQQLKQAYVELDTFFYRSSHDFRRPITTFLGLSEVAQITVKDESALDLFGKVKETAQALDKMIRKLQAVSDVGAQELVFKDVLLREMIENILIDFKDEIDHKRIRVIKEISLVRSFESYPALIKVIIENLVENAIQFCNPASPFVKISVNSESAAVVISVADNGQGIPEEYRERIYDMYFRGSVSSRGNGLGLYIVKKAISSLNGNIQFNTQVHEGTVFTVTLPA